MRPEVEAGNRAEAARNEAIRRVRNLGVIRPESHPFDPLNGVDTPLEDWDREFERRVGWLPDFSPVRVKEILERAQQFGYTAGIPEYGYEKSSAEDTMSGNEAK